MISKLSGCFPMPAVLCILACDSTYSSGIRMLFFFVLQNVLYNLLDRRMHLLQTEKTVNNAYVLAFPPKQVEEVTRLSSPFKILVSSGFVTC